MNPYLFIGAPIVVVFCVTLGKVSIDQLGWANAILGVVGFFSLQWIITFFYIEHPDFQQDEEKPSLSETFNRYFEVSSVKLSIQRVAFQSRTSYSKFLDN